MNISGRAVLVTGGASGIGLAFVRQLDRLGARVWVVDRNAEHLAATREALPHLAAANRFVQADVGLEAEAIAAVDTVEAAAGGIDVLINNAAVLRDQTLASKLGKKIRKHSLSDWNETLQSNLTGPFLMAREVVERMLTRRQGGLIVNISSISANGNPGQSSYAATKAAMIALTVTWSQELAMYGIRVCAIAPGFVETAMTRQIPPLFLETIRRRTPLQRYGTPEEFGHAIQFVIENDYFNGKVLDLDGGLRF